MSAPIYPMALKPRTNTIFKLYYVAFPAAWKELIIKLHLSVDPRFDLNYNLKTNVLYGYLNGWLDDVVMLRPLRQDSDDEKWLVSINESDLEKICEILQIWISSEYLCDQRATDETKELGEKLIDMINAEELGEGMTSEEALLFDADGHALTDHAFNAFALYAANTLCGKTIELRGNKLRLSSCGAKELICQPLSDGKENPHYYAFKLGLSLQTTPPERECMLLINTSVSRFISDVWKDNIYLKEKIRAYVLTGESKYKRMTISQFTKKTEDKKKEYHQYWNKAERNCYDLYSMTPLPDAEELLRAPRSYVEEPAEPRILLPYKNGMDFANMRVGVGVPVTDKYEISRNISELISDIAEPLESAEPVSKGKIVHYKKPDNEDERQENHINRLKSCTGKSELTIEIYGHDNDKLLQNMIIKEFKDHFGSTLSCPGFRLNIEIKNTGDLDMLMEDSSYSSHLKRIEKVKREIPRADDIIGAIIILPNYSSEVGDPKNALRAGFADTGRITQFITPVSEGDDEKQAAIRAHGAAMDIIRQLGYTKFKETRNMRSNPAFDSEAVGISVLHQLRPLWAERSRKASDTARFLPVYITYNIRSGKISVDCDIFEGRHLSYPEALIELSRLSRNEDFVKFCVNAARGGLRTKLLGLQNLYRSTPGTVMIQANGVTRSLWSGITDKRISEYDEAAPYQPREIELGTKSFSDMRSLTGTQLRIIRVRDNRGTHEVPDYYTEKNDKGEHVQSSGIYKFKSIFWGLEGKPFNSEYTQSYKKSKLDDPSKSFDECGSIEYYPIQLQPGDDAEQWVAFADYLREIMPEVSRQSVRLPAPLHLGELMREYLLLMP